MSRSSLRLRLVIGAAFWIAAALVLAGIAIAYMFTANAEAGARADLTANMTRLISLIDPDAAGERPVILGNLPDARYDTPASGVYWQIKDVASGRISRSRSLWDSVLKTGSPSGSEPFSVGKGPDGQAILILSQTVMFQTSKGERSFHLAVAQDRSILDAALQRFGQELTTALLLLGAVLILAALLQVHLGLAPLRRLQNDVESVRKGASAAVSSAYPTEVLPLVSEVNELLASQQKSLEFARARAADLAHGLKTPLAVLGTVAYDLERRGDMNNAELILHLTDEMGSRIDYQMRLVRLRHRTRAHLLTASLSQVVARAVSVIKRTKEGEQLSWIIEVPDDVEVDMDVDDLVELVGVILENAAEWGRSTVTVSARSLGPNVELMISDDGPGIGMIDLATLGTRGRRLDESKPGTGLGLAIAKEIVTLNNGSLTLDRSALGGLTVLICLPSSGRVVGRSSKRL